MMSSTGKENTLLGFKPCELMNYMYKVRVGSWCAETLDTFMNKSKELVGVMKRISMNIFLCAGN